MNQATQQKMKQMRLLGMAQAFQTNMESRQAEKFTRDFYGLNKGSGIVFFIFSVISDTSEYAVYNLIAYRVYYQYLVLPLFHFSVVVISHFSFTRDHRECCHMQQFLHLLIG